MGRRKEQQEDEAKGKDEAETKEKQEGINGTKGTKGKNHRATKSGHVGLLWVFVANSKTTGSTLPHAKPT
jgi:hypothetical protein